jgi:hypothetical protein
MHQRPKTLRQTQNTSQIGHADRQIRNDQSSPARWKNRISTSKRRSARTPYRQRSAINSIFDAIENVETKTVATSSIRKAIVLQATSAHSSHRRSAPNTLRSADKTTSRTRRRVTRQPHRCPIQRDTSLSWPVFSRHRHRRSPRGALHYRGSPRAKDAVLPVSLAIALYHSTRRTRREKGVFARRAARRRCSRAAAAMSLAYRDGSALVCR